MGALLRGLALPVIGYRSAMDVIALLQADHRKVEDLFARYESLGRRALKGRRHVVERIIKELSLHVAAEEAVLYPAIRAAVEEKETDDLVLESLEEHHLVRRALDELEGMDSSEERFHPKVIVLIESVRRHIEDEEKALFPEVSQALDKGRLDELGEALERAKKTVTTHSNPQLPEEPAGNLLAIRGAVLGDEARQAGTQLSRSVG